MTLGSEGAVLKALGIQSFEGMSTDKSLELALLLPDIAPEVQLRLIEAIPGLQKTALEAVNAVEHVLETTLQANNEANAQLHESMGDIRSAIKGLLGRDDVSEEHQRFLTEKLMETGYIEAENVAETRKFQAGEAGAPRIAGVLHAGIPIITAIVVTGARILISRGPRG